MTAYPKKPNSPPTAASTVAIPSTNPPENSRARGTAVGVFASLWPATEPTTTDITGTETGATPMISPATTTRANAAGDAAEISCSWERMSAPIISARPSAETSQPICYAPYYGPGSSGIVPGAWLCLCERQQLDRSRNPAQVKHVHRRQAFSTEPLDEIAGEQIIHAQAAADLDAPRSDVHGLADDGEVQPGTRTDIAIERLAEVETQPMSDRRRAHPLAGLIEPREAVRYRAHGFEGLDRLAARQNREERQDGITDELQHVPAILFNRTDEAVKIVVEQAHGRNIVKPRGQGGEVAQIGEQDDRVNHLAVAGAHAAT